MNDNDIKRKSRLTAIVTQLQTKRLSVMFTENEANAFVTAAQLILKSGDIAQPLCNYKTL